jgi:hypothetical protein
MIHVEKPERRLEEPLARRLPPAQADKLLCMQPFAAATIFLRTCVTNSASPAQRLLLNTNAPDLEHPR